MGDWYTILLEVEQESRRDEGGGKFVGGVCAGESVVELEIELGWQCRNCNSS
jgi:hypothetical protein